MGTGQTDDVYEERFELRRILEFSSDIAIFLLKIEVSFLCTVFTEREVSSASSERVCL